MPQRLVCFALLLLTPCAALRAEDSDYKLGPDSMEKPDVPKGKVTKMPPWTSKIFEGTVRDWWIYVPAQYDPAKPACVMVFQDGGSYQNPKGDFRVPTVFDNLIAAKEMPVTIGVFIQPGVVPAPEGEKDAKPRQNRSFEYDTLSDQYVRFLEKEILPEVAKDYKFSADPKDRDPNTAYSQSVEPLPFHGMSQYPYPAIERFPENGDWRKQYNTRPALRPMRPLRSSR